MSDKRVVRERLDRRNIQLGDYLSEAREKKKWTQAQCAEYLGTSRQRYGKLEAGTIPIPFVDLEALMTYLDIPLSKVWPDALGTISPTYTFEVPATITAGESVHVILRTK